MDTLRSPVRPLDQRAGQMPLGHPAGAQDEAAPPLWKDVLLSVALAVLLSLFFLL